MKYLMTLSGIFALLVLNAVQAKPGVGNDWVVDGPDQSNTATIYLSKTFIPTTGTYKVIPQSPDDPRETITGKFLIGQYKYLYKKPTDTGGAILVDETISTVILECREHFYGTLKQTKRLKNKMVNEVVFPTSELMLTQTSDPTLWLSLCQLYQSRKIQSK